MASASFSEDLTCSICLSVFTDPVSLHCGHSFCRKCISVSLRQWPDCPHCRTPVSVEGRSLLTNYILKSLAEKTKEAYKQKLEYRQGKKTGQWLCPEHDEKLKLYCITDQQLICVICRDGQKHESHKFKPVSEAATLVRTELQSLMKNISADTSALEGLALSQRAEMNKTKERARQLKSLISSQFGEMYTFLGRRERELRDKVKCDEEDGVNKMFKQLNAIEAAIAKNKKLEATLTSALEIQENERLLKTWSEENKAKAARSSFRPKGGNFQVEKTHLSLGPYESHLQMFVWKEMLQVIKPREERLSLQSDQTSPKPWAPPAVSTPSADSSLSITSPASPMGFPNHLESLVKSGIKMVPPAPNVARSQVLSSPSSTMLNSSPHQTPPPLPPRSSISPAPSTITPPARPPRPARVVTPQSTPVRPPRPAPKILAKINAIYGEQ